MPVDLVKEVWSELKRHINSVDRAEAAETLVSVMIDNDVDVEDIRSVFKNDADVKRAVTSYIKDHETDDEDEEEDEYDDEDDWEEEEDY
jgi:hypothetical protein